jgi:hypothetical protein
MVVSGSAGKPRDWDYEVVGTMILEWTWLWMQITNGHSRGSYDEAGVKSALGRWEMLGGS